MTSETKRIPSMTTGQLRITYLVTYEVLDAKYTGGTDEPCIVGPDGRGEYTDFEDLRHMLALKRGLRAEQILITSLRMEG